MNNLLMKVSGVALIQAGTIIFTTIDEPIKLIGFVLVVLGGFIIGQL